MFMSCFLSFSCRSNCSFDLPLQASMQNENNESHVQLDQNFRLKQDQRTSLMEPKQCTSVPPNQQQHNTAPLQVSNNQAQVGREQGESKASTQHSQTSGLQVSEKAPIVVNDLNRMQNRENEFQYLKLQNMSNQPAMVSEQTNDSLNCSNDASLSVLFLALMPQIDKDRAMHLQTLYKKLKRNEMYKDDFIRITRGLVGDQLFRLTVNQIKSQHPPSVRKYPPTMPSIGPGAPNFCDPRPFSQLHRKGMNSPAVQSYIPSSASQGQSSSGYPTIVKNMQSLGVVEQRADGNGNQLTSSNIGTIQERECSSVPVSRLEKQKLHFQQKSFAMYGNSGNYHQYTGSNITATSFCLKPQPHGSMGSSEANSPADSQFLQGLSSVSSTQAEQVKTTPGIVKDALEKQTSKMGFSTSNNVMPLTFINDASSLHDSSAMLSSQVPATTPGRKSRVPKKKAAVGQKKPLEALVPSPPLSSKKKKVSGAFSDQSIEQLNDVTALSGINIQLSSQVPATTPGMKSRVPKKKAAVGPKKPLEALVPSPPLSSKKKKVSGAFSDQSIEQLNDVTALSGINIQEEEEQLFYSANKDSRAFEASRKVVEEEEQRLLLQKAPLQKKLVEIMSKCGLKGMSNDVERCLSLCVEERLRGIISNLIRLSKQRVDAEKPWHPTFITSDVRQQIALVNKKAREEWEKKQAEEEKLRKLNDGLEAADDKDKDKGRMKSVKAIKEEDNRMRTTAANVAARAAVGGDDMLSKWQLMAEQARQKREGGTDSASGSLSQGKMLSARLLHQQQEEALSGTSRKFGRNQIDGTQTRVARSISVKDVMALMQSEPQMSRSTTMYRLYNRVRSEATGRKNRVQ